MDCYFCKRNLKEIDWRNQELLTKFLTGLGKIKSKEKTRLCAKHQRRLSQAIKKARHLGLLSPIAKEI
jgi:small subunit ribosomal protein S18